MRETLLTILALSCLVVESAVAIAADPPPLAKAPLTATQAREFQQQWAKQIDKELVHTNSIGMKLALLPPGEFLMGMTEEQIEDMLKREKGTPGYGQRVVWTGLLAPAHRVRITKPFYLGTTEVTLGQFRQFAEASGYVTVAEAKIQQGTARDFEQHTWSKPLFGAHDDKPVLELCWDDCAAFCKWLSAKEGREYALPTEAEWEYACRAGTTTLWSFGDYATYDRDREQYAHETRTDAERNKGPRLVGLGKPNAFGLYDMHGNVWEFVADSWHQLYYKESPLNDPTGPATQDEMGDMRRIIRGGSYDFGGINTSSSYRMRITQQSPGHHHSSFRVAMKIQGVAGAPLAVDPDEGQRQKKRDPGADSDEVAAALKSGAAKGQHAQELTIDLGGGVNMAFVLVPAGSFLMGSEQGPKDERPLHRVVISKPFYMAKYELTQSQWEAVMGKDERLEGFRKDKADGLVGPHKAMNELSWNACQNLIGKLKAKVPEHAFALPAEAQWEYACRAGSTTEFHFGDDAAVIGDYAWFQGNKRWPAKVDGRNVFVYHDVGQKKPNAFGLYDLHGGVWEWCADWYDADDYLNSPLTDPTGPASGRFRVLRGGSWFRYATYARSAYRRFFHPEGDGDGATQMVDNFGCRLVINLAP